MTMVDDSELERVRQAANASDRSLLASSWVEDVRRSAARDVAEADRRLRDTLLALVDRHSGSIDGLSYPEAVRRMVRKEFERIRGLALADGPALTIDDHAVRCDLRIACFGRIPTGVEHIELGGVPRSYLWRGSWRQALAFASCLWQAGGTEPFFRAHFRHGVKPTAFLLVCNRQTFTDWHRTVADCLRLNPSIKGLFASSWWYDPVVATVSPHLAFLRETSVEHGGYLFRYGPTEGARAMSIAHSEQRRALVERGEYVPEVYGVVWPRARLLAWAERAG